MAQKYSAIAGLSLSTRRMGGGFSPGKQTLASTHCATGKAMRTGGLGGSARGPGSLTGHCNSVWRRLPLTASGCLPSLRERVSGYFPSGVTTAGVPLSVFWSVATILPSFQVLVDHPSCPSSLATPNYRVTGIYLDTGRSAGSVGRWRHSRARHMDTSTMSRHD